eukprot:12937560-Heterocapsa_arctica.AAC.1
MAYGRCQEPRVCRWSIGPGGDQLVHLGRFRPRHHLRIPCGLWGNSIPIIGHETLHGPRQDP